MTVKVSDSESGRPGITRLVNMTEMPPPRPPSAHATLIDRCILSPHCKCVDG